MEFSFLYPFFYVVVDCCTAVGIDHVNVVDYCTTVGIDHVNVVDYCTTVGIDHVNVTKLSSLIFNMMPLVWPVFIHQSKCCKLIKRLLKMFSC